MLLDITSRSVATLNQVLSVAVSNLADYLHGKGLVLNPDKKQVLAIEASRRSTLELNVNCNGTPLTQTTTSRFLGLQIDCCLRRGAQVSSIVVNPLRFSKLSGSYDHAARGQLSSFTQYISLHRIINNEH